MGAIVLLQAGMSEKGTVTQQATHPAQRSKEYLASATALAVWILYTYICRKLRRSSAFDVLFFSWPARHMTSPAALIQGSPGLLR